MAAVFYGNLDEVRSTETNWYDDEEFEELDVDLKQFDIVINLTTVERVQSASKVVISFFEKSASSTSNKLPTIGTVTNRFLNGTIHPVADDAVWFRLSSLERLPSRSFTSKIMERLCAELFSKLLLPNNSQSIYLLTQQPTYDHPFEYYTNQSTDDLKRYQQQLPIMFTRASEGLLFEFCIKKQKKLHVLKLPMLLDEVNGLKEFLPGQLYDEIKIKNNYLLTSSNLYA